MSMINLPNFNFVLMIAILITFVNLIDTMTVLVTKSEKSLWLTDLLVKKSLQQVVCATSWPPLWSCQQLT